MLEDYSTFEFNFTNLDALSLEKALKEVDEIEKDSELVCCTPKGFRTITSEQKLTNDKTSLIDINGYTFEIDISILDDHKLNQEYKEINIKRLVKASSNNEEKFIENKLNSIIQTKNMNQIELTDEDEESVSNSLPLLKYKQNQRDCVVNKAILRYVRRVYLNLFKDENPKLVKRRFRNVQSSQFFCSLCRLVSRSILPKLKADMIFCIGSGVTSKYSFSLSDLSKFEEEPTSLGVFLFRFIGIKPKDKVRYSEEMESKGEQMQICMYKYSLPKLRELSKILEFKILFQYVYFNHLDPILNNEANHFDRREEYMSAFSKLNEEVMKNIE